MLICQKYKTSEQANARKITLTTGQRGFSNNQSIKSQHSTNIKAGVQKCSPETIVAN